MEGKQNRAENASESVDIKSVKVEEEQEVERDWSELVRERESYLGTYCMQLVVSHDAVNVSGRDTAARPYTALRRKLLNNAGDGRTAPRHWPAAERPYHVLRSVLFRMQRTRLIRWSRTIHYE
jgi:hypothetical protein